MNYLSVVFSIFQVMKTRLREVQHLNLWLHSKLAMKVRLETRNHMLFLPTGFLEKLQVKACTGLNTDCPERIIGRKKKRNYRSIFFIRKLHPIKYMFGKYMFLQRTRICDLWHLPWCKSFNIYRNQQLQLSAMFQ